MIYEHRTYTAAPGRMPDVLARFSDHTLPIWRRLGIRASNFRTALIGPDSNELSYQIEWESLAERERLWPLFLADPEWTAARIASEARGPIVVNIATRIMQPVAGI